MIRHTSFILGSCFILGVLCFLPVMLPVSSSSLHNSTIQTSPVSQAIASELVDTSFACVIASCFPVIFDLLFDICRACYQFSLPEKTKSKNKLGVNLLIFDRCRLLLSLLLPSVMFLIIKNTSMDFQQGSFGINLILCLFTFQRVVYVGSCLSFLYFSNQDVFSPFRLGMAYILHSLMFILYPFTQFPGSAQSSNNIGYLFFYLCVIVGVSSGLFFLNQCYYYFRALYEAFKTNHIPQFNDILSLAFVFSLCFYCLTVVLISFQCPYYQYSASRVSSLNFLNLFSSIIPLILCSRHSSFQLSHTEKQLYLKQAFVRYISHEMRTPLNVASIGMELLFNNLQTLLNTPSSPNARSANEVIAQQNNRCCCCCLSGDGNCNCGCSCGAKVEELHSVETADASDKSSLLDNSANQADKSTFIAAVNDGFELISQVKDSITIAIDILNDVLTYEKISSSLMTIEVTPQQPLKYFRSCLSIFELQAAKSSITLDIFPQSESFMGGQLLQSLLQNRVILVDESKMAQVVRNLASNALKFTPQGGRVVVTADVVSQSELLGNLPNSERAPTAAAMMMMKSTSTKAKAGSSAISPSTSPFNASGMTESVTNTPTNEWLRLSVIDSGAGISSENIHRVFNEIIQFDANKLQGGKGSGLGLYISKGIVDLHGGAVSVSSPGLGKGCTFTIELPLFETTTHSAIEISDSKRSVMSRSIARVYASIVKQSPPSQQVSVVSQSQIVGGGVLGGGEDDSNGGRMSSHSQSVNSHRINFRQSIPVSALSDNSLPQRLFTSIKRSTVYPASLPPLGIPTTTTVTTTTTTTGGAAATTTMTMTTTDAAGAAAAAATTITATTGASHSEYYLVNSARPSDTDPNRSTNVLCDYEPYIAPKKLSDSSLATVNMLNSNISSESSVITSSQVSLDSTHRDGKLSMSSVAHFHHQHQHQHQQLPHSQLPTLVEQTNEQLSPYSIKAASPTTNHTNYRIVGSEERSFQQVQSRESSMSSAMIPLKPIKRALVVDDSALNLKMVVKLLERMGYHCVAATDGAQAVEYVRLSLQGQSQSQLQSQGQGQFTQVQQFSMISPRHSPRHLVNFDMILMDNYMPVMSGPEACQQMRLLGYQGRIFGLTGDASVPIVDMYLDAGADYIFKKPIDIVEMKRVIGI